MVYRIKDLLEGFEKHLEEKRTLTREEVIVDYLNWIEKCKEGAPEEMQDSFSKITMFIRDTSKAYFQSREKKE